MQRNKPCITVRKQVSVIQDDFHDADFINDPLVAAAPTGALYQIQVENHCGEPCNTITLEDSVLGILGVGPFTPPVGGEKVTYSFNEFPELDVDLLCSGPGIFQNTVTVTCDTDSGPVEGQNDAFVECIVVDEDGDGVLARRR